jgi:predicted DNA-binding transcriptional regulator AlpA
MSALLRFSDLKARGICQNWPTLKRWILTENFPPGIRLGPNTRAWKEDEIEKWLAARSVWDEKGREP